MLDRTTEILLDALKRALAEPGEQRLYKSGKLDGLFASRSGSSAEAAALAVREGLLEIVRTETRGKVAFEWVRLTPGGVDFIHAYESPVRALRELRAELRCSQEAVPVWLRQMRSTLQNLDARLSDEAQKWTQRLDALSRQVEDALHRLEASSPMLPADVAQAHPWAIDALNYLDRRRNGGAPKPCPLPELFTALGRQHTDLAISAFHDGLRRLNDCRALNLEPAAGLDDLPQPEFALLDGGVVLYSATR
jgi:hypothetical protein